MSSIGGKNVFFWGRVKYKIYRFSLLILDKRQYLNTQLAIILVSLSKYRSGGNYS